VQDLPLHGAPRNGRFVLRVVHRLVGSFFAFGTFAVAFRVDGFFVAGGPLAEWWRGIRRVAAAERNGCSRTDMRRRRHRRDMAGEEYVGARAVAASAPG